MSRKQALLWFGMIGVSASLMAGCAMLPDQQVALTDRECLIRAMYFESDRSSEDGMLAVGTTVMNRLQTPGYPKTLCGVVGQPGQYARGVLTKPINPRESIKAQHIADAVLSGDRHPQLGGAMFFHTAGLTYPYTNMHYVAVAGGNAFYEKRQGSHIPFAPPSNLIAPSLIEPPLRAIAVHRKPETIDDLLLSFAEPGRIGRTIALERIPFPPIELN